MIESFEPERRKTFDLKIVDPDPVSLRPDVEAILRRANVQYELRSAGAKDLTYQTELPLGVRTDRLATSILELHPGNETEVTWEEKKKK